MNGAGGRLDGCLELILDGTGRDGDSTGTSDAVWVEDVEPGAADSHAAEVGGTDALPPMDSNVDPDGAAEPMDAELRADMSAGGDAGTLCVTAADCAGAGEATSCVDGVCAAVGDHSGGPGEGLLAEWDSYYDGLGSSGTVRPYGSAVGEFCGVTAFSNANSSGTGCFYARGVPMGRFGIEYQCVEYVLRFLCLRFAELDCALTGRNDQGTGNAWQWWSESGHPVVRRLAQHVNGGTTAPAVGDVLVYPRDAGFGGYGHVAIIRHVAADHVLVIEQNVQCTDRDGERRIPLEVRAGRYSIPGSVGWLRAPGALDGCEPMPAPECRVDADCGATTTGTWSGCEYADACDENTDRTRTNGIPRCSGSVCSVQYVVEAGSCTRNTDGTVTGSGTWGSCGGFSNTCDETGTQSRSVSECSGGGEMSTVESRSCTRDTDGTSCSSGRCSDGVCAAVVELLNYQDDDGDGRVDEDFRVTLYRRGASNGVGYTHPQVDADHCWSTTPTGESCIGPELASFVYGYDGRSVEVYSLSIGSGSTVSVGTVVLSRLMQCWSATQTEHQSAPLGSQAYTALVAAGFTCTAVGYVKTGTAVGTDPEEVTMRVHRHDRATTTMYSSWVNEAQSLGFEDRGAVWFAWRWQ